MPLPAAPNSSGKFRAPFTPRHWAFSPRNSSVALFLFSPPMQTPPLQLLRRFRVPYPLRLPLYLRPPHRFPQPHRQRSNRLQPLFSSLGNLAVVFSVDLREQQFRVSQDSGQRVIQFVPQHFSEVFVSVAEGFRRAGG